jgi:hypothetical protein
VNKTLVYINHIMNSAYALSPPPLGKRPCPYLNVESNLCSTLKKVSEDLLGTPCRQTAEAAYSFLMNNLNEIREKFDGCKCKLSFTPSNPPLFWDACLDRVQITLYNLLMPPLSGNYSDENPALGWRWISALEAYKCFYTSVKDTCCADAKPQKWVIKEIENASPFHGRTICVPTTQPQVGEKAYNERVTCEFALYRNALAITPWKSTTKCNEFGCWQQIG